MFHLWSFLTNFILIVSGLVVFQLVISSRTKFTVDGNTKFILSSSCSGTQYDDRAERQQSHGTHLTPYYHNTHITHDHSIAMRNILSADDHRQLFGAGYRRKRRSIAESDDALEEEAKITERAPAFTPGSKALPFTIPTLGRNSITFPADLAGNAVIIHTFDNRSGFVDAMWSSSESIDGLLEQLPNNVHFVFLSRTDTPYADAVWMRQRIEQRSRVLIARNEPLRQSVMRRMHFSPVGEHELGNWIPEVMKNWRCSDFNCGYYQVAFRVDPYRSRKSALEGCTHMLPTPDGLSQSCRYLWGLTPLVLKRQDARYDWTLSPQAVFKNKAMNVVFGGHACKRMHFTTSASGSVWSIEKSVTESKVEFVVLALGGMCSHANMVHNMALSGATGLIIMASSPYEPLREARCSPSECTTAQDAIAVTSIPYDHQLLHLIAAGAVLTAYFQVTTSDNFFIGIDSQGRLQEIGSLLYPSMQFLNWAATGMLYRDGIDREVDSVHVRAENLFDADILTYSNKSTWDMKRSPVNKLQRSLSLKSMNETSTWLMKSRYDAAFAKANVSTNFNAIIDRHNEFEQLPPRVVVDVFTGKIPMQGHAGAQNVIRIPDVVSRQYRRLKLDLQLPCAGATDKTCAKWDHAVRLTTCCRASVRKVDSECMETMHQLEIGRWVSPYRRGSGRWLTDISPLLPIFRMGEYCNFTIRHPWWSEPWYPKLSLRFAEPHMPGTKPTSASSSSYAAHVVPLFIDNHAPFDNYEHSYAARFRPLRFTLPPDLTRATIYAVITGHGSDLHRSCAEFCVTRHTFTVNERNYTTQLADASTPFGCAAKVREGVTPNQHGTWLYGRAGWCPGQHVEPWVVDITKSIKFTPGDPNVLSYSGAHASGPGGKQHPFSENDEIRASINIVTYLILHRSEV